MKTNRALALCALVSLVMCKGLTTIDVSQSGSSTVPKGNAVQQALGSFDFGGLDNMDLSQSQTLQNQGVTKDEINSVFLRSFAMTITSPTSGQDFSFLQSIKMYAKADGQPEVLVAQGSDFGAVTTINLDVENVDLAPYVAASSMTLTSTSSGKSPDNDTTIEATAHFDVDVNLKGAVCGGK